MRRRHGAAIEPARQDIDAALAAMGPDELRETLRELMLELDDRAHSRVVSAIINRAARGDSGWAPAALAEAEVAEVVGFAGAAMRVGSADPSDVDERLRRGTAAFLRKDYPAAHRIFGALLRPIAEAEIDLGQHEMLDEVLGVDANECAAQYVLSTYMTSDPSRRAKAVRAALDEMSGVGYFFQPLREMERAAVEPLPGLDEFLSQWRDIVAQEAAGGTRSEWDSKADRWLREVVQRMEGPGGLERLARSTRRADDLRAWCESLVSAGDWRATLAAFEEAADLVAGRDYARGEFLDGAALAAREAGRKDLSPWLERAWRGAPTLLRLRRWLGSARSRRAMRNRVAEAIAACPRAAHRQRAFLHVLEGESESAAKLLAAAPGLGWSSGEHPGHLLFPLCSALLGGSGLAQSIALPEPGMDIDDMELLTPEHPASRLATPEIGDILRLAGIERIADDRARRVMLAAMRRAAGKRIAGVIEQKRRRHYGHAASLVATCVACDRSAGTVRWAAGLREQHRRYPALRAELDRYLASP